MISSNMWPRLHLQLDVTSQRHYCASCNRQYVNSFGQIVEIMTPDNTILYARAALPPTKIEDVCTMDLEMQFKYVKTLMHLWGQIRTYEPVSGNGIVRSATDEDLGWNVQERPDKEEVRRSMAVLTDHGKEILNEVVPV